MERKITVLDSFRGVEKYNNFISPITLENMEKVSAEKVFMRLLPIEEIATKLHISSKRVLRTIGKMLGKQVVLRDFFSYEFSPVGVKKYNGILVAKKCASCRYYSPTNRKYIETYYDAYLVRNTYYGVGFNIVFRRLLTEIFPQFFVKDDENQFLFKEEFKYTSKQRECLRHMSRELTVSNIPFELRDLTLKDITTCLCSKKRITDVVHKSRISCYHDSDDIYIYLFDASVKGYMYERSLYVPIEALFTKDYDAIANAYITSQAVMNGKGEREFINGRQADMPYFKNERTQKILTYLLK